MIVCDPKHEAEADEPDSARVRGVGEKTSGFGFGVAVGAGASVAVGRGVGVTVGCGVAVGSVVAVGSCASAACAVRVADGPEMLAGEPPLNGGPPLRNISVPPPQMSASMVAAAARIRNSLPCPDELPGEG